MEADIKKITNSAKRLTNSKKEIERDPFICYIIIHPLNISVQFLYNIRLQIKQRSLQLNQGFEEAPINIIS